MIRRDIFTITSIYGDFKFKGVFMFVLFIIQFFGDLYSIRILKKRSYI